MRKHKMKPQHNDVKIGHCIIQRCTFMFTDVKGSFLPLKKKWWYGSRYITLIKLQIMFLRLVLMRMHNVFSL